MGKKKMFIFIIVLTVLITAPAYADILKIGSTGASVEDLQNNLINQGYLDCDATGYFGNLTEEAVIKFQTKNGLKADGLVGEATLNALQKLGTSLEPLEEDVKEIQTALKNLGFYDGIIDGLFGPMTEESIKAFQTSIGLSVDGIVGDKTKDAFFRAGQKITSRGVIKRKEIIKNSTYGEMLDWWTEVIKIFPRDAKAQIIDVKTGKSFNIQRSYGGNHADCETLTKEDTNIMKKIWGGKWSWDRRPVIVVVDDRRIAASMIGMPHAGLDAKPKEAYVKGRSGGFGSGTNLDAVKGNGMDGHFCVHFLNSRTHGTNKVDAKHQANIKIAAGK
ncbi:MAG: peptidoglycan-binding protein [Clostridiales bacterium]|nr:peptidoglycan-binding protein [Clostridiales bacterium]